MTKIVNKYRENFEVYIGRGSPFGNDYSHIAHSMATNKVATREEAIRKHKNDLLMNPELMVKVRKELKGKILGCFCKPEKCHGDTYTWLCDMSEEDFNKLLEKAKQMKGGLK